MERNEEIKHYHETLVGQLQDQQRLRTEAAPEALRIFVNRRCVGRMSCEDGRATFISNFEKEAVDLLEVRTDCGILVGSASGTGAYERTCQVRVGNRGHVLTLHLENHGDRGTVKVSYQPTAVKSPAWGQIGAASRSWITHRARWTRQAFSELSWAMQMSLTLQFVLAVGLVFLLLHPVDGGRRAGTTADLQAAQTLQAESDRRQIARMRQDIEALVKDQQLLRKQIVSYEKSTARSTIEIEHRVERRLLRELQKTTIEAALKQQAETLSRMKLQPSSIGPQSSVEFKPLTFSVSFHEGTPEESVQDLLQQIHGRKIQGPTPNGWINIEAQLTQSETFEEFFETIRKFNIVSAIKMSLTGP